MTEMLSEEPEFELPAEGARHDILVLRSTRWRSCPGRGGCEKRLVI
jgi:hypothetical protein